MKRQTILKAWALFGVYWFITFTILTFASSVAVIVLAALSLYAGIILAIISIASLIYERVKLIRKAPIEEKKAPTEEKKPLPEEKPAPPEEKKVEKPRQRRTAAPRAPVQKTEEGGT